MDAKGALQRLLSEQRRELESVIEQWAERQELAVLRAVGSSSAGTSPGASACVPHSPPACRRLPTPSTSSSDLLPATSKFGFSDRHFDLGAQPATVSGSRLPRGDLEPGTFQDGESPLGNVGVTSKGTKLAMQAIQENTHSRMDTVPVASKSWWASRAKCADSAAELKVEAWCPKLDLLATVVTHVIFESVVSFLLLTNVAVIGLRVELQAELVLANAGFGRMQALEHHPDVLRAETWATVESVFIVFFTAELLLRLLAFRVKFFVGKDRSWNIFDMFLVASSVPELLHASGNLSYLRLWRILKLVKMLRVVRVARAFHELRLVLSSIIGSVKALVWSMILVTGTTYMVSIAFVQSVTDFVSNEEGGMVADSGFMAGRDFIDDEGLIELFPAFAFFRSVPVGMRCLLASVTGGMDWLDLSNSLWDVGPAYTFFFFAYICFFHFVIFNTMTSLFLDGVMQHQDKDQASLVHEMLKKKVKLMADLADVHHLMCEGGSIRATREMFRHHMMHPEMMGFARTLEVDIVDLELVFDILSQHGEHDVDLESFVVGCIRLKGKAKSVDVISLRLEQRKFARAWERQFADLRNLVARALARAYVPGEVSI